MTSKTSLLNGGIFKYNIKRFWWLSALFAYMLFMSGPNWFFSLSSGHYRPVFDAEYNALNVYGKGSSSLLLMAGIIGICVFRYMQKTRSVTLFHALPVNRAKLYLTSLFSGFVLLAVPILLNGLILLCMCLFGGFGESMTVAQIGQWFFDLLLVGIFILSYVSFVGVFTGSSVAQGIFSVILYLLPFFVMLVGIELLDGWLFGFTSTSMNSIMEIIAKGIPYEYPAFFSKNFDWWTAVLFGIYILLFVGFGLFFYRKRDVERAGDIVTFSWVKPIFLYGVTFCMMLFGTMVFSQNAFYTHDAFAPNIFSFLLFALIGYAIAKMLLTKTFKVWKYYKGYGVFAVIVLIIFYVIDGTTVYGNRVPNMNNVEQMYVGTAYGGYSTYDPGVTGFYIGEGTEEAILTSPEDIAVGQKLHREIIRAGKVSAEEMPSREEVYIRYQLKNGREMVRRYWVNTDVRTDMHDAYYDVFNTKGAKDHMYQYIRVHPEKIEYVAIAGLIFTGESQEELIGCIQRDIERLNYRQLKNNSQYVKGYSILCTLDVTDYENTDQQEEIVLRQRYLYFNEDFTETMNWISEHVAGRDLLAEE